MNELRWFWRITVPLYLWFWLYKHTRGDMYGRAMYSAIKPAWAYEEGDLL